ncbi:hypothetical protein ACHAW6_003980, partial [Cyclotella cf. meneghiniana]
NIYLFTPNALALQDAITLLVKQSCNHLAIHSPQQAMQVSPYPNFPSQQNRHTPYQDSPTICFRQPSLQMQAVNYSFTRPISLLTTDGPNIVPHDSSIASPTEPTLQTHNIYECKNTRRLINFYYATIGYPVVSTWCKATDKGYFQGWNGLTSERVCCSIKPSEYNLIGHLDQKFKVIRSTKSSTNNSTPDSMAAPPQTPLNDKTNMVFMTMVSFKGQLFTDQTKQFSVTSNRGNNYIVIFYTVNANHIKSY